MTVHKFGSLRNYSNNRTAHFLNEFPVRKKCSIRLLDTSFDKQICTYKHLICVITWEGEEQRVKPTPPPSLVPFEREGEYTYNMLENCGKFHLLDLLSDVNTHIYF